jgi:hypothetical protein
LSQARLLHEPYESQLPLEGAHLRTGGIIACEWVLERRGQSMRAAHRSRLYDRIGWRPCENSLSMDLQVSVPRSPPIKELGRACQARMASINGLTPRIAMTRFML